MENFKKLHFWVLATLLCFAEATTTTPPPAFAIPSSSGLDLVNLLIGNGGDTPNGSGGMIPSTAPPFAMTRWVAQTQPHFVSATPYNWTLDKVMGVVGTRQPAIWMGESAPISVSAGIGPDVVTDFEKRGLEVLKGSDGEKKEVISSGYYSVELDDGHGGSLTIEQTASEPHMTGFVLPSDCLDSFSCRTSAVHVQYHPVTLPPLRSRPTLGHHINANEHNIPPRVHFPPKQPRNLRLVGRKTGLDHRPHIHSSFLSTLQGILLRSF